MRNITEFILNKANNLKLQEEVTDPKYQMFDDGGVERETGEFLYGLVKLLKPNRVLTTGIYSGISDLYIGLALQENGFGISFPIEYEEFHYRRARELWGLFALEQYIAPHLGSSLDYQPEGEYQLMFLDSEPNIRFKELERFFPHLAPGGFVFIHDLPRSLVQGNINPDHPDISSWPFGDLSETIKNWLRNGELIKTHLPSPRGLTVLYKRHLDDYTVL